MFEKREIKGLWWLPEDDSHELSGTLNVDKGQVTLETIGHFGRELISETEREKTYSHDLATRQRILGFSSTGKRITVEGDQGTPFTEHFPGMPVATYRRSAALIGKHFEDDEDIGFDEIKICASDLNAWTRINGFEYEYELRKDEEKGFDTIPKVRVEFDAPDDVVIPLSRGDKALLRFTAQSQGFGTHSERVSLTQQTALHLQFAKRKSLEEVYSYVGQVRNFLTLAVGRPVSILSVTGYQNDYVEGKFDVKVPIELIWRIPHNPDPPEKTRHPRDMLFTLPEDTAEASKVMRGWFAKQKRLKPVFNLFFGARFHPDMYLEVRFLTYAQAIETYDYRRRSKPSDLYLAKRMSDILGTCQTVSKRIIGTDTSDRDTFIKRLKDSRNYYTHYNPKLEDKAAEGVSLHLLTTQLQAIIEMSLLRELGFGCRSVDAIFERVRRYNDIQHLKSMVDTGHT